MNTISQIQQHKIVAIIRGANPEDVVKIAHALYDGGIRVLEITLNSNDALSVIRQLSGTMENKLLVGAGTVLDADSVKAAVDAGAKFIISPSLDTATIEATKDRNMVSIPGAFTATEILAAYKAGGDIIKVFPASVGAGYIRDLRGPFPHIPLMPTGGVNLETIKEYMQAGAVAVGIGSALVDTKQKITDEYLQQLTTKAAQFMKRLAIFLLPVSLFVLTGCATAKAKRSTHPPVAGSTWNLPLPANASLPMQWVPSGTFTMGSPVSETGRKNDESPQTEVTITNGYWLGKTEVTVGQWKAVTGLTLRAQVINMLKDETVYDFGGPKQTIRDFMRFNPNDPDKIMANENDSLPMYFVSWDDAMSFCKKLTEQEQAAGRLPQGYLYSLPTEAQWEFACRAGTTDATFAGPLVVQGREATVLNNIAWYGGNNAVNYTGKRLGNSAAGPRNAGEKSPNAWGLQDMPGNLWEWCRDWYGPYPGGKVTDPGGPASGTKRVDRGGSWGSGANDERSANRASNPQPEKSAYRGFRIALVKE